MKGRFITAKVIAEFREHLILNERSSVTVEKYIRDVKTFAAYTENSAIIKENTANMDAIINMVQNLQVIKSKIFLSNHQVRLLPRRTSIL